MSKSAILVVVALLAAAALAAPFGAVQAANEDLASALGWGRVSRATADRPVSVYVALKHSPATRARILRTLKTVSDPQSSGYGQFLSRNEVSAMAAPKPGSERTVRTWLAAAGLSAQLTGTGDMLKVTAPVAALETLLGVELAEFRHAQAQSTIVRTVDPIVLPAAVAAVVDFVGGVSTFPNLHRARNYKVAGAPAVTAALVKSLYNITEVATGTSGASQAVAEFQAQSYLPSDLKKFEADNKLPNQPVRNGVGPAGFDKSAQVESSLDIQFIIAAGTGVPSDFWLEAGQDFDLLGWASYVLNTSTVQNQVWSVSYGEGINGGIGGVIPVSYATRLDVEFQKFGLIGHSVLIASGDSGVWNREPLEKFKFHPSFPACLPHVTAVGATQLQNDGSETTGVSFSGGGFTPRNYFTRAASAPYQNALVQAYFTSGVKLPNASYWDNTGRGIPDVSAVGVNFDVVIAGITQGVSGTSASTPTVAGIIGLINDKRMAAGQAALGFLNPFLYQNPGAFRDILLGYNDGGDFLQPAFYAAKGWDPVTGLGTPNYVALKAAALKAGERTVKA